MPAFTNLTLSKSWQDSSNGELKPCQLSQMTLSKSWQGSSNQSLNLASFHQFDLFKKLARFTKSKA
ncbi:hypothetical protein P1X15_25170 [Runella sp. MFBS21]|uniref:hypothetical protein n=1 Tax=Runella sp. MFBS21 TaxID=3034018 RepID=UPI0023F9F964|nr:hypothetical protein [Runella sp. MFBS21]MDF7820939.1 hypothetical protein [Runella sp. MFBS21]